MKNQTGIFNSRVLIEFLSVAFAVLFALLVNQWKENRHNNKLARASLENIHIEISNNKSTIEEMMQEHEKVIKILDSLVILSEKDIERNNIDLNISFELLSNTAWDAALLTQSISYMDMETVMEISMIYKLQEYYDSFTKEYIIKNIYNTEFSINKDIKEIKSAQKFFTLILKTEKNLLEAYDYAFNELLVK